MFSPITSDAHVLRAEERGNFESKVERITKIKKKIYIYIYIDADPYILSHFARPLVSYRQVEERLHAGAWEESALIVDAGIAVARATALALCFGTSCLCRACCWAVGWASRGL